MRVGGADESMVLCGDWKLWVAMALTGRIAYLGEPLNYYRVHDTTVRAKSQRLGVGPVEYLEADSLDSSESDAFRRCSEEALRGRFFTLDPGSGRSRAERTRGGPSSH